MTELVTKSLDQLDELAELEPTDLLGAQRGDGPMMKTPAQALLDFLEAYGAGAGPAAAAVAAAAAAVAAKSAAEGYRDEVLDKVPRYIAGIFLQQSAGVLEGGYPAEVFAVADAEVTRLYSRIVTGGGAFDLMVLVNGAVEIGPLTVEAGSPVTETGLTLAVPSGGEIEIVINNVTGEVTSLVVQLDGAF